MPAKSNKLVFVSHELPPTPSLVHRRQTTTASASVDASESNHEFEQEFSMNEIDEEGLSSIRDLTSKFKQPSGVVKMYTQASEYPLAMFAVTQMVNSFGQIVRNSRSVHGEPGVTSISTGVNIITTVYSDVCATLEFKRDKGRSPITGIIQGIMLDDGYRVSMASSNKEGVAFLEKAFNRMLEQHNFYQGASLRFGREVVEFIPVPSTELADVIMPQTTRDEYNLNVVQFLTNPNMQKITKKRGMLFYGPPGGGKTSGVKAMFKILSEKKVTCIYVSDASFERRSVEEVFTFINRYLAPVLVVFEDIDLIAPDRREGGSRLIGPLLSALNGIEEQQKPIVILATTNRVDVIDSAITRPCRFDRRIQVDYPTESELHMIFKTKAGFEAPRGCFADNESAKLTGAHVEEIYRTAALLAEQNSKSITECITDAVATVKKHFMIVAPKVRGFGGNDDYPGDGAVGGFSPPETAHNIKDDPFR